MPPDYEISLLVLALSFRNGKMSRFTLVNISNATFVLTKSKSYHDHPTVLGPEVGGSRGPTAGRGGKMRGVGRAGEGADNPVATVRY